MIDEAVRKKVYDFLEGEGLRKTAQRDAIMEAAFSTTEHYTAEDLLRMAKSIDRSVSRATVYRTLPLLVRSGLLREMDFGKAYRYYDPNFIKHPHHNHLICIDCDKIVEFEDERIEHLEDTITHKLGFSPAQKTIRIEATCDRLKQSGSCGNKCAGSAEA